MERCDKQVEDSNFAIQKFFTESLERHETYLNLSEDFHRHKLEVEETFKCYKNEFNAKMVDHS